MKTKRQIEQDLLSDLDELNVISEHFMSEGLEDLLSDAQDLLIFAYKRGWDDLIAMLDYEYAYDIDITNLYNALNQSTDGMSYINRLILRYEEGKLNDVQLLMQNEYHRMYNVGAYEAATKIMQEHNVAILKEWHTMLDDKVRETHVPLQGYKVPLDGRFEAIDGDSALYPGGFSNASNNLNCRCIVTYSAIEGESPLDTR